MKIVLSTFIALLTALWGGSVAVTVYPESSALPWIVRQEALNLTGLLSIALMSFTVLLSTRPRWLETPLGGLDRVYRLHKWAGILALGFGTAHWLVKQSGGLLKSWIGGAGRLPKVRYDGALEVLRELGKDLGEPALYLALALLALTLWRRFPYAFWRLVHRAMPVLYLMLALHAAVLAPPAYWTQPVGWLLAVALIVGVAASAVSLGGRIGRRRRVTGRVVAVRCLGDDKSISEISCQLDERWPTHAPGQFAFVRFAGREGAHPFTIASADRGDRTITFLIKGLGRYTRGLAQRVEVGQAVTVEGPYGRFELPRHAPFSRQVWVAAGIGVTPFLAWLEALQTRPDEVRTADLHYCTRDRDDDPLVARLQALCAALPGIRLAIHSDRHGERLDANALGVSPTQRTDVWYCGPNGFAEALKAGLGKGRGSRLRFHQEAFELR